MSETVRRTLLVHIDPAHEIAAVDGCLCKYCINDYYAILAEAIEAASNAEGIDVAVCYSCRVNRGKAAELHDLVCDMVADRLYRHPCGRIAQIQAPRQLDDE